MEEERKAQDHLQAETEYSFGFTKCDNNLLYDSRLSRECKFTFIVLRSLCRDHRMYCWPRQKRLAQLIGVSVRALQNHLADLDKYGWLTRTKREDTSSIYTLKINKTNLSVSEYAADFFSVADATSFVPSATSCTTPRSQVRIEEDVVKNITTGTIRAVAHIQNGEHVEGNVNISTGNALKRLSARQWASLTSGFTVEDVQAATDYIGQHGSLSPSGFKYDQPSTAFAKCLEGEWWKTNKNGGDWDDEAGNVYVADDGRVYEKGEGNE